jgi:carboxymethylenebutenolidase
MDALQRYLAEEIAIDHADGLFSRREALRRLGLMGVSAAAASGLLAACASDRDAGAGAGPTSAAPAGPTPLPTQPITFTGTDGGQLQAAWAPAAGQPFGAVLVIHENRGLTDHIRSVAGRLAASGYSALALDLLSEEGGTAALGDSANATAALSKVPPERFVRDMKAALGELSQRMPGARQAAIGFCFGGGMVWRLLASGEPRLSAAVPFYGPLPETPDFAESGAAVLGIYAANDTRITSTKDQAEAALTKAGLPHDLVVYPGVDHAFFNDTGARYDPTAAAQAYQKMLDWFGRYLA